VLEQQRQLVITHRSGESISIPWLLYFVVLHGIVLLYGWSIHSVALIVNGLLTFCAVPLLISLWEFEGFTIIEYVLSGFFSIILIGAATTSFKEYFFFWASLGGVAVALLQPLEIWKNKSSGVVDLKIHITSFVSAVFWILYGYKMHIWVLQITSYAYLVIAAITIMFWILYRSELSKR